MKIVTILGARPQFIKAGTVSREIQKQISNGKNIQEIIIHTGQHYDVNMSDIFFDEMHIPKPKYFLGIGGKSHGAMTGQMIENIEEILIKEKPSWVLVYGDTNSTLAGAIAASKLQINIAHVEAGLRSFNNQMPEEINRILTDRLSRALFCPTKSAVVNLQNEGIINWGGNSQVFHSGDVMQDGALYYSEISKKPKINNISNNFILCTIHRAENTDNLKHLNEIFSALNEIADKQQIILPMHPRTKKIIESINIDTSRLTIIEPVSYLNMIWLLKHCSIVMTDSGGLQKEAFFFEKHCITLRNETEWVELVEKNLNKLVGTNKRKILATYEKMDFSSDFSLNLYGKGLASKKIVDALIEIH
ncbi:UDP-N-acetylglucosamine 2-epimerase (non-hydrolyzing) [Cocleimonas sp. KMM 6892]|uniref:non-hydrolyzing UDP-N-acetylglucosamine 2-epimerase n=1 Tax=unclassified Cocleimonas TaxID=2639732 RepID=UPI002DBC2C9C|nr:MULTISPECIES: UDP-N-acetylglucosamine 2-epimerase (non-hydrolyzing) [unclassified Cocleimonas]MEB8430941.1 UDP-N-acetylglucosamine 2-epimerase (non-hydrolyzing) [Cocleimonas sp. KMM 6892]MEC4714287.1 UDP-N-acetylglucosamine 2-epimerase (non-hydrolyzing) [Cocleimonas sp. KMM 6895]MEC4743618.1 UDP-N-acetylglucosamine 2-epimerase (non-hydrolyzing) [Cocleimonas sp. KMM 6896]